MAPSLFVGTGHRSASTRRPSQGLESHVTRRHTSYVIKSVRHDLSQVPQQVLPWRNTGPSAASTRFGTVTAAAAEAPAFPLREPTLDDPADVSPPEVSAAAAGGQPAVWEPPQNRPGLYDAEGRLVLKCLTLPELEAWCAAQGESAPANRALQLWRWMYADPPAGHWVRSLEETRGRQNGFSAKFIEKASPRVSLEGGLRLQEVVRASDGTRKLVFAVTGGEAAGGTVETVLIPIVRQQGLRDRLTICVSSQVGCAMNCQFCYTGRMGLLGNLSTAQIVEQVVEARRFLAQEGDRTQLTNLVFMGMGEPLHNTEAVLAASEIMSHYLGLHISHNKITISTVGLVPELRRVVARSRVQVALSLHATTDEVRDWIVPVNRRYDLATLTAALEELFPKDTPTAAVAAGDAAPPAPGQDQHHVSNQHQHQQHQQQEQQEQPSPSSQRAHTGCEALQVHQQQQDGEQQQAGQQQPPGGDRWLPPLESPSQPHPLVTVPPSASQSVSVSQSAPGPSGRSSAPAAAAASVKSAAPSASAEGASRTSDAGPSTAGLSPPGAAASSAVGGGRSLLVEYTMLAGINDTREDAERLAALLSRVNCKVNLIVFNPHAGTRFQPSRPEDVSAFRSLLVQRGLVCTIRDSRGDDEMAACGQLGNVGLAFRPSPILEAPERFRQFLLP